MSVYYQNKDITTVETGIVAHGVNCQKVMGSGVAKAIREKWPSVYTAYMATTPEMGFAPLVCINTRLWVANCYTQRFYGKDGEVYANLAAVGACLVYLVNRCREFGLSLYMPRIGCGLGGLKWEQVQPLVLAASDIHGTQIVVCDL